MSIAIRFDRVGKQYRIQEDRTFKELLPSIVRGRTGSKEKVVFENVSFSIQQGETVGIVGRNGAGKSTILKLIAGVTAPTSGTVTVSGSVAPLIELGAGFHHELSGFENIYLNGAILGMTKSEIEQKIDDIIAFSEISEFIHTPVKRYSSGMYMRLGFAVAVHTAAPILLIDEVLAVGDLAFQEKCLRKLKQLRAEKDRTIVFISHHEAAVKSFCERCLLLEDGSLRADGKPDDVLDAYHQHMPELAV